MNRDGPLSEAEARLLALDPAVLDALLAALTGPRLPARRLARLRARVLEVAGQAPVEVLRMDAAAFRPLFPGVRIRPLRIDRAGNTQSSLWRMDPGAVIPAHDHAGEEECLVLEGSILWNGAEYRAGDYLLARPGAHHEPFVAPHGALLMIRSELTPAIERVFEQG